MTLDLKAKSAVGLDFDKVQELRDLKDESLSLGAYCKSSQDVVRALKDIPNAQLESIWDLGPYDVRLEGFKQSLSTLSSRISNSIDLVCDSQLNMKRFRR